MGILTYCEEQIKAPLYFGYHTQSERGYFNVQCLLVISEWLVPVILREVMAYYFAIENIIFAVLLKAGYEGFCKLPNLSSGL